MLRRDHYGHSYTDIATELEVSVSRAVQLYHQAKRKQLRLYARHLAIVHGHQDTSAFECTPLYHCYGDCKYISAYWEKEYAEILKEYRAGEPGHSAAFLAQLLPPVKEISENMEQKVKSLREEEGKTFVEIGREMNVTKEKARNIYERLYHKKWLAARDRIRDTYYGGKDDLDDFRDHYKEYRTAKKRLEGLMRDYPELFEQPLGQASTKTSLPLHRDGTGAMV